ncbi:hypothetical protein G4X40_06995 [Rhodococcus sp. D2-41]|uniref:DUF3472 domain-containing protein n=1 Tax=Speluncibacter jeojiensis TaxID=2710754 RepID=UPI0024101012|nr:hypothetical protein [Rhodococcus sp. D2-41]MDG3009892.1 hypothetical protein [Rhodococcus sp. D2-41]
MPIIRRALVIAAGLAAAVLLTPSAANAATGQTPGTYAGWSVPANPTSVTIPMTLQVDPGKYNAFWSNQFSFAGVAKVGGYFGLQTHANGGGMFLASIWNGVSGVAGSPGSYCQRFNEGGTGETCRANIRPIAGHLYNLHIDRDRAGTAWTFTVQDATAGTSTTLGTITLPGVATLAKGSFISWTEYFDWNNPKTVCSDAKYSKMLFGIPASNTGAGKYTGGWKSKTCQDMSRVTLGPTGATEENGPLPMSLPIPFAGSSGSA